MELPLGAVQEARKEEMTDMKKNTFQVVKRTENGEAADQYEMGRH